MLQILRNKAQSTVMQAVVVVIALVFIFWGVGTRMMNSNQAAISINGEEISFQQFQKSYEQALAQLRDQFNGAIPQGLAEKIGIKQQVINRFIQDALLRQGAVKMGLIISPAEVQDTIETMPVFQDNGSFSLERYKSVLARNGYTPHKFESSIQVDMLSQRAMVDIGNFASIVTEREIEDLYGLENESVSVTFARISPELFRNKVQVTDKELSSWFETVKDNYKTAPQLRLKYLSFNFNEIGKKISIDEASVKNYYDKNKANFTTPEPQNEGSKPGAVKPLAEVHGEIVHQLQLEQAKDMAFQVANTSYEGIIGAGSLEAYIKDHPETAVIETAFFSRNSPPADIKGDQTFLNTAFALKQGELSSLIKTKNGYAILYADQIKEPVIPPMADIKAQVTKDFVSVKAAEIAKKTAEDILSQAKTGGDFAKLVNAAGLSLQSSGLLSKGNPDQKSPFPLSLLGQIFELSAKSPYPSEPGESDKDYFVYKFAERTTPKMALNDSERDQYRNALLKLKQQQILNAWLDNQRKQATVTIHKGL